MIYKIKITALVLSGLIILICILNFIFWSTEASSKDDMCAYRVIGTKWEIKNFYGYDVAAIETECGYLYMDKKNTGSMFSVWK